MSRLLNTTIGEYRLVDFLGAGGMGEVYRAIHVKIGRVVAIKMLSSPDVDATTVQRFLNKARIQSNLRHPGIAMLYDFPESGNQPVIIMEYVDGQTLCDRIAAGPMPVAKAARVMSAIADAVAYIHSLGIVHRDLKTANIKINSSGQVKLLDFGIAKDPFAARMTKTRFVVGTFQSMAPVQLEGKPTTPASDMWSLGVILYEITAGQPPFAADDPASLIAKFSRVEYIAPTVLNPVIPREIEQIIGRCLRRRPADRFASAAELKAALEPWTSFEHASAIVPPEPRPQRSKALIWRAGLGAAAAIAILAGGIKLSHSLDHTRGMQSAEPPAAVSVAPGTADQPPADGTSDTATAPLESITLDVVDGTADVYERGRKVGSTPYTLQRRFGDSVDVTLKREGFQDLSVRFDVTERKEYMYTMDRLKP